MPRQAKCSAIFMEEVEDGEADELMPNLTEEDIEGLRLAGNTCCR